MGARCSKFSFCWFHSHLKPSVLESSDQENGEKGERKLWPSFGEFSLEQLKAATNGFSSENIVSEHGEKAPNVVYKGKLDNGQWIAINVSTNLLGLILANSSQVGSLRSERLANLVGYCYEGEERLLVA